MREFLYYPPLIKLYIFTHRKERLELRLHKHMEILWLVNANSLTVSCPLNNLYWPSNCMPSCWKPSLSLWRIQWKPSKLSYVHLINFVYVIHNNQNCYWPLVLITNIHLLVKGPVIEQWLKYLRTSGYYKTYRTFIFHSPSWVLLHYRWV